LLPLDRSNVDTVRTFFDRVMNGGEASALAGLVRDDVLLPQSEPGIESLRAQLMTMRATFASPEYRVMETIAEGDRVVARFSANATHAGRYMGLPATGRKLKIWGVMLFRFDAGGAVAEFWSLIDAQGILAQLRER
jgi:predicted ester cyclase